MRKNEHISIMMNPMDLDKHFIYLSDDMDDLSVFTEEEQKFGLMFLNGLGTNLENQEMLEISGTPESIFCMAVKSFRRSKV